MCAIWGIGVRNFKGDLNPRYKFRAVIEAIMMYGMEIWGWQEQEVLQKIVTKYGRWVLGLDWNTPKYIMQEEVGEELILAKAWWREYKYRREKRQSTTKS